MAQLIIALIALIALIFVYVSYYRDTNYIKYVNKHYDDKLNKLMDENTDFTEEYLSIRFENCDFNVWTGNYPYAYGNIYPTNDIYPSMKTRKRLKNYIVSKKIENI